MYLDKPVGLPFNEKMVGQFPPLGRFFLRGIQVWSMMSAAIGQFHESWMLTRIVYPSLDSPAHPLNFCMYHHYG